MSQPTANTGTMKKGQRGHSTRRRFTFSEPSAPAELAVIQETYTNTRQQTNIPNQANSPVQHERKLVAKVQEERERTALRKGRSLPTMGRAKRERRMADLFGQDAPAQQDSGSAPSVPKSRSPAKKTTSTPVIKIAAPRPCLTDPTTPVRWAGGAFENSPPPSSLPIPVFDDEDLCCGSTSDGEQPQPVDSTLIPFISSSPVRHGAASPNQSSPLPAENQPLSPQATTRPQKEFIQPPLNPSTSPLGGLHYAHQQPVFLFPNPHHHYVGPLNHSPEPSAFYQPLSPPPVAYGAPIAMPAHPQPSRDLDQISSDLRRMLGISVST